MSRAVFLDRDETLNRADSLPAPAPPARPGDVTDPDLIELLPGVSRACSRLRAAGLRLIVYTNQGVVARGGLDLRGVERVNDRIRELLPAGTIDAFYVCPYHPAGNLPRWTREHPWRKPGPGMITAAATEMCLDLRESWAVGDKPRDIESAIAAGIPPDRCLRIGGDAGLADLASAAEAILGRTSPNTAQGATVRLRALQGSPLADVRTRATVIAAAGSIAERTGVRLVAVAADDRSITVTIDADRLAGLGFLAELRRNTNAWFASRHTGLSLWGEAVEDGP